MKHKSNYQIAAEIKQAQKTKNFKRKPKHTFCKSRERQEYEKNVEEFFLILPNV